MAPKARPSRVEKRAPPRASKRKYISDTSDAVRSEVINDKAVTLIAPSTRLTLSHIIFYRAPSPLSNFHQLSTLFPGSIAVQNLLRLLSSATYHPSETSKPVLIPHPNLSHSATILLSTSSFHTVEQWLMSCKGWLFEDLSLPSGPARPGDPLTNLVEHWRPALLSSKAPVPALLEAYNTTLATCLRNPTNPLACKRAGRLTQNLDKNVWNAASISVVVAGLLARAEVDPELRRIYAMAADESPSSGSVAAQTLEGSSTTSTTRVFVEAAPRDKVWGVGMGWERVAKGEEWRGENRMGICHGLAAKEVRQKMKEDGYE